MRLIDADAVSKDLIIVSTHSLYIKDGYNHVYQSAIMKALNFINDAPTIDAVPVVHGRWDDSQSEIIGGLYHEIRECSECGWTYDMVIEFNYCPNCGAKMDEEGE